MTTAGSYSGSAVFLYKESFMRTCPRCSAPVRSARAAYCPEYGYSLSKSKRTVGKHEIKKEPEPQDTRKAEKKRRNTRQTASRKPHCSQKEGRADRIKISPDMERTVRDDGYDGYYDDVLPTDDGEYRQGLDRKTAKNILYLLIGVIVIVGICVVILYYS